MESRRLSVRAVICDVYQTLLEVGPPPADAAAQWAALWRRTFGHEPPCSLLEFAAACSRVIAREHAAARACGIAFPEVWWPAVVAEVLPAWRSLAPVRQAAFIAGHMQLGRSLRLMPGAAAALRALADANLTLGLASNAQAYTWGELDEALRGAGPVLLVLPARLQQARPPRLPHPDRAPGRAGYRPGGDVDGG
jgi:FMN phosphatase YigB (HAD superfamily)